jgi:hypothetical protein
MLTNINYLLVIVMFLEWKTMKFVSSVTAKISFSMPRKQCCLITPEFYLTCSSLLFIYKIERHLHFVLKTSIANVLQIFFHEIFIETS